MDEQTRLDLYQFLSEYVSEDRKQRFEEVLARRTRYITTVLEDIYQPQNASAVIRSCEGMGIQDLHIIEHHHDFSVSESVTIGAEKWLTLHNYRQEGADNTLACIDQLKGQGYKICATTPHTDDVSIQNLPLDHPVALAFGSEMEGLSDTLMDKADYFVRIPMFGFSESYNISVSAAICLYELRMRLSESDINWQLSEAEKQHLRFEWTRASVKRADMLERYFFEKQSPSGK